MSRDGIPGRLIDVGGHRVHVHCSGEGSPAVVFDAALGASSLSWSLVLPAIARVTTACAWDRAGFGWSEAGPLPRTARVIAEELHSALRRAGVAPPYVLVGHSFGALTIRTFAARYREDVAGVVFVDPAHPEEWLQPGDEQRAQIARGVRLCRYGATAARIGVAHAVAAFVGIGALAPARALVKMVSRGSLTRSDEVILAPIWKLPPDARRPLRRFWTDPKFFVALGSQIGSICETAAQVEAAGLAALADIPLVVISAGTSSERRRRLHVALARSSSRGRFAVAAESGHWVPLDEPEVVISSIVEIVGEVRAA